MRKSLLTLISLAATLTLQAQDFNIQYHKFQDALRPEVRNVLNIPDIMGYKTLKCDFHNHTVFSDGEVTPGMRVAEAWCEGLDAIAITDHNKYKSDLFNADYNKSYDLAKERGDEIGIIVIKGVEYTDRKPVGHFNFLFIDDANQYEGKIIKPQDAVELAASKGAFIIYNHPGWPDRNSELFDFQKNFIAQKKIHAMEVFNQAEFYPVVIDYCLNSGLAPLGCSDIHSPANFDYDLNLTKRPMTLVFADKNSVEGIKEALFAGRTVAYGNGILAGKEEYIRELFVNSLLVSKLTSAKDYVVVDIANESDISYTLESEGKVLLLPAGKTVQLKIKNNDADKVYSMKNGFCWANKNVQVKIPVKK